MLRHRLCEKEIAFVGAVKTPSDAGTPPCKEVCSETGVLTTAVKGVGTTVYTSSSQDELRTGHAGRLIQKQLRERTVRWLH